MDSYYPTDSSDASSPHTPSPRMDHSHLTVVDSPDNKHFVYGQPDIVYPPDGAYRPPQRGGLLGELYDDGPWQHEQSNFPPPHHQSHFQPQFDPAYNKRFNPFMPRSEPPPPPLYAEPLPLHPPPHHHHMHPYDDHHHHHVKLEPSPLVVPTQIPGPYYPRPGSSSGIVPFGEYLPQHPPLPVMHTDDAASKETQYLRRRCHNCHTTEPPSWRRSTLNPGKIVCNKCGLYERTHLRARPQRFDELRASNKARKNSSAAQSPPSTHSPASDSKPSPPAQSRLLASPEMIKREPGLENGSTSDWDDNLSVYSSSSSAVSSLPPSAYGSPMTSTYSLSGANSPSPTLSSELPTPIRVPNAPLTDIMGHGKAYTTPGVPGTPPFWNHGPVARRHTLAGAEQRYPGSPLNSGAAPPTIDSPPTDANGRPRKGSMS